MRHVAVIDIGKTNAKLLLIDLTSGAEVKVYKTANRALSAPPYLHFDAEALWGFLLDSLADLARHHPIDAISITTHGACAALVDGKGDLVLPILDYEDAGPDNLPGYDALRPGFAETGSPRLPGGLNLGAQIYFLQQRFPEAFGRVAHILTYPQYWAARLTGVVASELTSLGCHTDLWNPWVADFSSLVDGMGWRHLFPAVQPAAAVLGPLLPALAQRVGLPLDVPVLSGIHDSNASLVPYLAESGAFSVISTGTWMISLAVGGPAVVLDATRDTLVNVNARGTPTPTARYMGGREFDELTQGRIAEPTVEDHRAVLAGVMILPSLHADTGPFPGMQLVWTAQPATDGARTLAASWYAALMAATCLELIGAQGPIHVEGPFGGNVDFAQMLASVTGRVVIAAGQSAGTGLGAALLAGPMQAAKAEPRSFQPGTNLALARYAAEWRGKVQAAYAR